MIDVVENRTQVVCQANGSNAVPVCNTAQGSGIAVLDGDVLISAKSYSGYFGVYKLEGQYSLNCHKLTGRFS